MKNRFFFGLMVLLAAAAFLAACNADDSGAEEAAILDSAPRYGISIITEKEDDGGMVALTNTDGVVTASPAGRVKAGSTVTLSVRPELIAALSDPDGGGGDPEYWFVKSISGAYSMEGGPERTNVSFRPSPSATNVWTFSMTPGNIAITVDFTRNPDETTAALSGIYPGAGDISPVFTKNKYDYTIAVPFDSPEFSISAQAENPYLTPVMLPSGGGGDNLLDKDLMAAENGGPLSEGLSHYEVSVSSADGKASATYNINVIRLPDLSLATFKVTKADGSFERDLAPVGTQDVYVPYTEGISVLAEANDDSGAGVNINPSGSISGLTATSPVTVSVTVSKPLVNVDASLTSKTYVLKLYYGAGMAADPLASGGYVSFIPGEDESFYYEMHTFKTAGTYTLSFFDTTTPSITADYLIVAGGGGGGNKSWSDYGGGGGAGGLLYETGKTLTTSSPMTVTVGAGGAANTDGGYSHLGTIKVPGGGKGGNAASGGEVGGNGGSGGGNGSNTAVGEGTTTSAGQRDTASSGGGGTYSDVLGYKGGTAGSQSGGGGGGARGAGGDGSATAAGAGGAGWKPSQEGAAWIKDVVTATTEFSHGGKGGISGATSNPAANYGDGGNASASTKNGYSGIVVVRFHPASADAE
jgi:hypothetical protein